MVGRGIPRICRGEPRNFANGAAEFGKICHGKLWALVIIGWYVYVITGPPTHSVGSSIVFISGVCRRL